MFVRKNLFGFEFTSKNLLTLLLLAALPNFFGWLVLNVPWGAGKFHIFQVAIFLAAGLFGPLGGILAGSLGAVGSAVALNNPYIIVGNVILGGLTGYLYMCRRWHMVFAVLAAFAVQLPWLYYSDIYLAHMPVKAVEGIIVALMISNLMMALIASAILPSLKRYYGSVSSGV
ncbi:MAG: hypothetical protein Q7T16_05555 [Candidatus Burarchaeum sp.]|nr:hypothetical protein [Candidatus Burarchaeum sp.]MDO8340092.1 hypothetical protein [Candidatus Burarchaeum sp.]